MKINTFYQNSANYPSLLRGVYDPPDKLFVKGTIPDIPLVAVVGSRKPTGYGRHATQHLVSSLVAHGVGIVSGLAYGIDSLAHQACMENGGITLAVMAGGLDAIYPSRNRNLAQNILGQGAIISEYPTGVKPQKHHFIARNRIIAGLSQAVVVVEAAHKSGSLWTADFALQVNRPVLAVPGPINSVMSQGANDLIAQGARIVTSAQDILNEIGVTQDSPRPYNNVADPLIAQLGKQPLTAETLAQKCQLEYRDTLQRLTVLEMRGLIQSQGDGTYAIIN